MLWLLLVADKRAENDNWKIEGHLEVVDVDGVDVYDSPLYFVFLLVAISV